MPTGSVLLMGASRGLTSVFLVGLWSSIQAEPYSFITLGDWGGVTLGGFHVETVKDVARQMGQTAAANQSQFVVNVGDNFYYCGIKNVSDSQIEKDYTSVYTAKSLQIPWYSALGNHEYGYNVDAQVQFTQADPTKRWYLPARYYTKRVQLVGQHHVTFIVLDTNPCIQDYRNSDPKKWDPCGSDFPTCEPTDEGTCHFHENILAQDCASQLSWLKEQLATVPSSDWLIIVGHHPAHEVDVEDFLSVLEGHGFDLYLNGHVHTLEHYAVNSKGIYVTSGAGAMVHTSDQVGRNGGTSASHGSYESIWEQKTAGFTLHTFSEDFASVKTEFLSSTGKVLHSFTTSKHRLSPPSHCGGDYPCKDGCTHVNKANEGTCGVRMHGCYRCADLPPGCPACPGVSAFV